MTAPRMKDTVRLEPEAWPALMATAREREIPVRRLFGKVAPVFYRRAEAPMMVVRKVVSSGEGAPARPVALWSCALGAVASVLSSNHGGSYCLLYFFHSALKVHTARLLTSSVCNLP